MSFRLRHGGNLRPREREDEEEEAEATKHGGGKVAKRRRGEDELGHDPERCEALCSLPFRAHVINEKTADS